MVIEKKSPSVYQASTKSKVEYRWEDYEEYNPAYSPTDIVSELNLKSITQSDLNKRCPFIVIMGLVSISIDYSIKYEIEIKNNKIISEVLTKEDQGVSCRSVY